MILRIDDRYVHGQVIAGWVRPLGINHLILVSDDIASDDWAKKTYTLAVPDDIKFSIAPVNGLASYLDEKFDKTMIVVGSIKDAFTLLDQGLKVGEVNLGCLSYDNGKREICSYIYLNNEDIEYLISISKRGIKVTGRALPNSPVVDVIKILKAVKH